MSRKLSQQDRQRATDQRRRAAHEAERLKGQIATLEKKLGVPQSGAEFAASITSGGDTRPGRAVMLAESSTLPGPDPTITRPGDSVAPPPNRQDFIAAIGRVADGSESIDKKVEKIRKLLEAAEQADAAAADSSEIIGRILGESLADSFVVSITE